MTAKKVTVITATTVTERLGRDWSLRVRATHARSRTARAQPDSTRSTAQHSRCSFVDGRQPPKDTVVFAAYPLTRSELQSRFGDKPVEFPNINLTGDHS